jgi:acetyl esterase
MTPSSDPLRMRVGRVVLDAAWNVLSHGSRRLPIAQPERHGVTCQYNVPYTDSGDKQHLLDVYRPADAQEPLPVVMYIHGGGFRILSKDSHWGMGLAYAKRGYVAFLVNYRLAPKHRYPAAVEDVAAALLWIVKHAAEYGGDPSRIILAGESAGANLATSLALMTSYRREEPFARAVFDANIRPQAVIAKCGMHQVSDPQRFFKRKQLPLFLQDRILEVSQSYLPQGSVPEGYLDLADPVVFLERGVRPERPLPPFFSSAGTADPILDDTRRLHAALERLGTRSEVRYYRGQIHAFQAIQFLPDAKKYWKEMHAFLKDVVT